MSYEQSKRVAALQLRLVEELRSDNARLREQLAEQRLAYAQVELERERLQEQIDEMRAPPSQVLPVAECKPCILPQASIEFTEFQLNALATLVAQAIMNQPFMQGSNYVPKFTTAQKESAAAQARESHPAGGCTCDC